MGPESHIGIHVYMCVHASTELQFCQPFSPINFSGEKILKMSDICKTAADFLVTFSH